MLLAMVAKHQQGYQHGSKSLASVKTMYSGNNVRSVGAAEFDPGGHSNYL